MQMNFSPLAQAPQLVGRIHLHKVREGFSKTNHDRIENDNQRPAAGARDDPPRDPRNR